MAISGCDFYCNNDKCESKGCGLVMSSPWPLGDIDQVINAKNIQKNTPFREGLMKRKEQGVKYACITLPNIDSIPIVGYRIHRWCEKCLMQHTFDVLLLRSEDATEDEILEATLKEAKVPENCPTCNTKLKTYEDLTDEKGEGIMCTSCKTRLTATVWFSNE
jgi:hypothetical protein